MLTSLGVYHGLGMRFAGTPIIPRLIRLRDAPDYLGMDRNHVPHFLGLVRRGTVGRRSNDSWIKLELVCHEGHETLHRELPDT